MRTVLRRPSIVRWALAAAFAMLVALRGSRDVYWMGDFYLEIYPAYHALIGGDVRGFFDLMPAYSGFGTVVGGPAALLTGLLGGQETMVFRLTVAPGMLALAAVGVALARPLQAAGNRWWPLFLVLGCGGPLAYVTIEYGHPEDLLATGLALAAVLAARDSRVVWASVLLVGAVVAKQWAVLAILPAAMAAPRGGLRILIAGGAGAVALLGVQMLLGSAAHGTITSTGLLFHPHQIWWPLGIPATPEFIAAGHGSRMGPTWLQGVTRPAIVSAGAFVAIAWWWRSGEARERDDIFGVLALIFLLRCMLDPWDLVYYHLPLVVSLAAWEARRGRDLPVLAVVASACIWLTFVVYDAHTGNGPFLAYLAWSVPLAVWLGARLLAPRGAPRGAPTRVVAAPATR